MKRKKNFELTQWHLQKLSFEETWFALLLLLLMMTFGEVFAVPLPFNIHFLKKTPFPLLRDGYRVFGELNTSSTLPK